MSFGPSATERGALIAGQREHWETTLQANPQMYGTEPSDPALQWRR